jgi:isoquinoline 1-oxidoreductase beta subunit
VVHVKSGRKLGYAALVADAAALPEIANVQPMPPERRRYVGRDMKRLDIPAKVDGSARYGLDANPRGALVATVRQAPRFGGTPRLGGSGTRHEDRGVRAVVKLDDAVAVVAKDYWTARRGLDALVPRWDDSKASTATSPAYEESLVAAVKAGGTIRVRRNTTLEAMTAEHGAAMAKAGATVESIYTAPFLAHATMEPMNGTALVTERARSCGCRRRTNRPRASSSPNCAACPRARSPSTRCSPAVDSAGGSSPTSR